MEAIIVFILKTLPVIPVILLDFLLVFVICFSLCQAPGLRIGCLTGGGETITIVYFCYFLFVGEKLFCDFKFVFAAQET